MAVPRERPAPLVSTFRILDPLGSLRDRTVRLRLLSLCQWDWRRADHIRLRSAAVFGELLRQPPSPAGRAPLLLAPVVPRVQRVRELRLRQPPSTTGRAPLLLAPVAPCVQRVRELLVPFAPVPLAS